MSLRRVWNRFFQATVPIVRIDAPYIDPTTTAKITSRLSKINKRTVKGLAVYVDTHGGSAAQCEIIRDKIRMFCDTNNIPLYTCAGSKALGAGYYLLSMGDKIYVSDHSMVGGIEVHQNILDLSPLMQRLGIENRFWKSQDFLYSELKRGRGISEEHIKDVEEILEKQRLNLVKSIDKTNKLHSKSISIEDALDKGTAGVLLGTEAVKYGLADSVGTIEKILMKEFPQAVPKDFLREAPERRIRKLFKTSYNILTSKRLLVVFWGYMIGSTIVEIYIALLGLQYTYSGGSKKNEEQKTATNK